jgi:hypothetical protein
MVEDLTKKTITDIARHKSEASSLSLLPRKELSDVQSVSTQKLSAYTHRKEEEHTVIFFV